MVIKEDEWKTSFQRNQQDHLQTVAPTYYRLLTHCYLFADRCLAH